MWLFYVSLLSVFLSNSICRSVSAQQQVNTVDIERVDASQSRTIHSMLIAHLTTVARRAPSGVPCDNERTHSIGKRANSVTPSGHRSPLLEVMLRILDTIQLVPKKRSRRAAAMWKPLSPSERKQTLLNSLDPGKVKYSNLFFFVHFLRSLFYVLLITCGVVYQISVCRTTVLVEFWCHVVYLN